jgi:hypothetical protein
MSQPALPPHGTQSTALPTFGTLPLGPDEPELFAHAMERILAHLSRDEPAHGAS